MRSKLYMPTLERQDTLVETNQLVHLSLIALKCNMSGFAKQFRSCVPANVLSRMFHVPTLQSSRTQLRNRRKHPARSSRDRKADYANPKRGYVKYTGRRSLWKFGKRNPATEEKQFSKGPTTEQRLWIWHQVYRMFHVPRAKESARHASNSPQESSKDD